MGGVIVNSIRGILTEKRTKGYACCQVGGIEWLVAMSQQGLAALGAVGTEVRIFTQLKVSENNMLLYGFATQEERALFEALISVSGIGPKVALAMLSQTGVLELATWIMQGDVKRLAKLPGLGAKTAQKLILQLSDKLEEPLRLAGAQSPLVKAAGASGQGREAEQATVLPQFLQQRREYEDLLAALVAMGYEERRSRDVLDGLFAAWRELASRHANGALPAEGERLRQAIVALSAAGDSQ